MASYSSNTGGASNQTSPKSASPTFRETRAPATSPRKVAKGEGTRIDAPAPEWATGPGYWFNDGYEVRWIHQTPPKPAVQTPLGNTPTHFGHGGYPHPYEDLPNQWVGPNYDDEEPPMEELENIPLIEHEGENIIIEKRLYGNRSFSRLADREFSELFQEQKIDLKKFFEEYDKLFYEIPKQGEIHSHNFIVGKSTEYIENYIDPKDEIIDNLEEQVQTLEEELELLRNPDEHPFYRNGTVISRGGGGTFFYMDKGKKRKIVGGRPSDVWAALKASLGYKPSQDDFGDNIVVTVPDAICDEIPTGPGLGLEDLGSGNIFTAESARQNVVRLNGDDYKIDPSEWNNLEGYKNHLEKEIEEAWHAEHDLEARFYSYRDDEQYEETEEKRAEAKRLADEFQDQLRIMRNRLVKYKKIYEAIESNANVTLEGLDKIYEFYDKDENITRSDRKEFAGWEKGRFDDREGKYGAFGDEDDTRNLE